MGIQIRQGDVFLERIDVGIEGLETVPLEDGRIVLAHGEATGHAHVVTGDGAALLQDGEGGRFLDVREPCRLRHEEHDEIGLEEGLYRVLIQREYTPEAEREVLD